MLPREILERFQSDELIPAIAQDSKTREVLMLAWMNQRALEETLKTGRATYWSRSRNQLWVKGETSGNFQEIENISYDCDADTLLLAVRQKGVACHTGEISCFHNLIEVKKN